LPGQKPTIRAVTFDLWETLIFEETGSNSRRARLRCQTLTRTLNELGIKVSMEKTSSAMNRVAERLLGVWADDEDLSHRDQLSAFLRAATDGRASLNEDIYGVLSEAYVSAIFDGPPSLNPEAFEVLDALKKRKKGMGLICNSGITPGFALRRLLSNHGILDFFDCLLFSDETGIRKPDPRMFRSAADHLGVGVGNIVHVGDNLRTDIGGAKATGCMAVYFASDAERDKEAEANPKSLVTLSRNLGKISSPDKLTADWTIYSLKSLLDCLI